MEKASTPRNRLTRSTAKQVNTPKNVEQEESVERSPEVKHNVRKTRRRNDTKANTNGDTTDIENRITNENKIEDDEVNRYEQEGLNLNDKSQDSFLNKNVVKTPSPTISRRSLRNRSSTPGPELESSASKKSKRSSSVGKLDLVSTPTPRRGRRAKSESKDFVFTPLKDKQSNSCDPNSKYIPGTSLRIIDKIDELNEGEKSGEDEGETVDQETKPLNNFGSEGGEKIIEPVEKQNDEQSESQPASETSFKGTDQSVCPEKMVNNKGPQPDSNSQEYQNSDNITNISRRDSGVVVDCGPADTNGIKEVNDETNIDECKPKLESCSLPIEDVKSPTTITISEDNETETGLPNKEILHPNELKNESIVSELANKTEETPLQASLIEVGNIENPGYETQKTVKTIETKTHNITVEIEDENIENSGCETQKAVETINTKNHNITVEIEDENIENSDCETQKTVETIDTKTHNITVEIEDENIENSGFETQKTVETIDTKTHNITVEIEDENIENSGCETQKTVKTIETKTHNITVEIEEIEDIENSGCETQKTVETIDATTHNSTVEIKSKSENANIEMNIDDDDESVESSIEINKEIVRIVNEELYDEDLTSCNQSYNDSNRPKENESKTLENSNIHLVMSSDSDNGSIEEMPTDSGVNKYNDELYPEDTKETKQEVSKDEYKIECLKIARDIKHINNQFESKSEKYVFDSVKENGPKISEIEESVDQNIQEPDEELIKDSTIANSENITYTTNENEPVTLSGQPEVYSIEDDLGKESNETQEFTFMDKESSKSCNLVIENPHTLTIGDPVRGNECQNLDQVYDSLERKESQDENHDEDTNHSGIMLDRDIKPQSEDNYDEKNPESEDNYDEKNPEEDNSEENYEDEELIKSEEGSCDIYKGLSDTGSDIDEKEGSQFGGSASSELQSGSGDSEEEYGSSVDEDEENVKEKTRLINELCSAKELMLSRDGEKPNEKNPDSPMTYDKALAIINKNRVKKIDDEEFFDMFTQELNRVSEESGSDSDIAIVDEYLLEPEEPATINQPKSENGQNSKQPPRLTGPAVTNQSIPPENYPGVFNQPIHAQHSNVMNQHNHHVPTHHNHPAMQRVNLSQGAMYQQFDQNMHLRNQLMYNQYAHPSGSMQDSHMFNPPGAHPNVDYVSGMFGHPSSLGPELAFPPNSSPLKIRSVVEMNKTQTLVHKNYGNNDHNSLNTSEARVSECQDDKDNYLNASSLAVNVHKTDSGSSRPNNSDTAVSHEFSKKKGNKSRTPILDLLGLDEKALKLLKKVLGLNSIKRELMKRDLEWQKKCLERSILKSELRQKGKSRTRLRNRRRFGEDDSSSWKSSSDQTSESSGTSYSFAKRKTCGGSGENSNRDVNIEDDCVYITFNTRHNSRFQNKTQDFKMKKANRFGQESPETAEKKRKTRKRKRSTSSTYEFGSKKMAKKQPATVKSQCGTFTVDPLTTSSQSSDSEVVSQDEKHQIQELKRKMKHDLASGKNKLSNMFLHHSFQKTKEVKKGTSEPFQEIKGPLRRKNLKELKKLPSEILESLAKEEESKKRDRSEESGSDDISERPKKVRKKNRKMKIKGKAGDQNYIPCVTGGATEFGLSRLDKDGTLTLAEKAAKFRTDQLYGGAVKRITILDFKHQWC